MLLFGTVVAGAGATVGLLGGVTGVRLFNRLSETPVHQKLIESYGAWHRSIIIGLVTSLITLLAMSLGENPFHQGITGLVCLLVSFVSATLYVFGSLTLLIKYGPAMVEAGELSLAGTVIVTAFLCVCGLLWITLQILGGCVLLAATVLNGIWIYRLR